MSYKTSIGPLPPLLDSHAISVEKKIEKVSQDKSLMSHSAQGYSATESPQGTWLWRAFAGHISR